MSIRRATASIPIAAPIMTKPAPSWRRSARWNFFGLMRVKYGPNSLEGTSRMKTILASIFAVGLLAAPAAQAAGVGIHVGPIGVGAHVGGHYHHHHGCRSWGYHH